MNNTHLSKVAYVAKCAADPSIPIFLQSWWLDACCPPHEWGLATFKRNGEIVGALPYMIKRRAGITVLTQPPLTPFLGCWIKEGEDEREVIKSLLKLLPKFDRYTQGWSPLLSDGAAARYAGFTLSTLYTMRLNDLTDLDAIWSCMHGSARREIRKATGRFSLKIKRDATVDDFIRLNRKTFERQGNKLPYDDALVHRLDAACAERKCRKILIAEDPNGDAHAGAYVVWDEHTAYYLMGGGDPELRTSGASTFCMWEAIMFASTVTKHFDFEGSMIEPIERFFRSFGAERTPYLFVSKTNSLLLQVRDLVQEIRVHNNHP